MAERRQVPVYSTCAWECPDCLVENVITLFDPTSNEKDLADLPEQIPVDCDTCKGKFFIAKHWRCKEAD